MQLPVTEEFEMLKHIAGFAGACALVAVPVLAQDHSAHSAQSKLMKGSSVAIEGCVTAGQKTDSYVLGSVKEIPGGPVETGMRRVYWLDSTKQLKGHAGHVVRVEGRIDKIEKAEIEVKIGEDEKGGAVIEIEGAGKQVKTAPGTAGISTAGQTAKEVAIPTTLIRLNVDKVTMLKGSCS